MNRGPQMANSSSGLNSSPSPPGYRAQKQVNMGRGVHGNFQNGAPLGQQQMRQTTVQSSVPVGSTANATAPSWQTQRQQQGPAASVPRPPGAPSPVRRAPRPVQTQPQEGGSPPKDFTGNLNHHPQQEGPYPPGAAPRQHNGQLPRISPPIYAAHMTQQQAALARPPQQQYQAPHKGPPAVQVLAPLSQQRSKQSYPSSPGDPPPHQSHSPPKPGSPSALSPGHNHQQQSLLPAVPQQQPFNRSSLPSQLPQPQPQRSHHMLGDDDLEAAARVLQYEDSQPAVTAAAVVDSVDAEVTEVLPSPPQPHPQHHQAVVSHAHQQIQPQASVNKPPAPPLSSHNNESEAAVLRRILQAERQQNGDVLHKLAQMQREVENSKAEIIKLKEKQLFEDHARQLDDDAMEIVVPQSPPHKSPSPSSRTNQSVTQIGPIQLAVGKANTQMGSAAKGKKAGKGVAKPSLQTVLVTGPTQTQDPTTSRNSKRKRASSDVEVVTVAEEHSLGDDDWVDEPVVVGGSTTTATGPTAGQHNSQNDNSQTETESVVDYRRRCQEYYLQLSAVRRALRSAPSSAATLRHLEESVVHGVTERVDKSLELLGERLSNQLIGALDRSKKRKTTDSDDADEVHEIDALRLEHDRAKTRVTELEKQVAEFEDRVRKREEELAQHVAASQSAEESWSRKTEEMSLQFVADMQQLKQKHDTDIHAIQQEREVERKEFLKLRDALSQDITKLETALQKREAESAEELRTTHQMYQARIQTVLSKCDVHVREAGDKEKSFAEKMKQVAAEKEALQSQLAELQTVQTQKEQWMAKLGLALANAHAEKERLVEEIQQLKCAQVELQSRSEQETSLSGTTNATREDDAISAAAEVELGVAEETQEGNNDEIILSEH